jgi:hypothetical protein
VSEDHDTGVAFNTTPVSDRRRRKEEDSSGRKNTGGDGAAAPPAPAPQPTDEKRSARPKVTATTAPDSIELTDRHLKYAAEYGFSDPKRVRAITDHFLSHHRFKGTKGKDWYAGWQGWIRRQREMDDEKAQRAVPARGGSNRPAASRPVDPALAAYDEG